MQHTALATRYRPQSFADVKGQDMLKAILSRAAATDKIAPAYLLSGTRGVGKTTLARIFAKALNCVNAPCAEPCNVCDQCKHVMQGNHVDVLEIDGASNRGIDDARRLRESVNYAPMEGRYKVFIIDEAHMLTNDAFNALLKTLEEPPPRTTFILATTEAHKFPVTIISRCQHFTLKALNENSLTDHLERITQAENIEAEANALRLLARRAAGSVRDGMSLLGQVMALGEGSITEESVRNLLGLAGQEAYERVLLAIQNRHCLEMVALSRELLERGLDIGFFLRELALLWRNLLLFHEAGDAAATAIDLPEADKLRLQTLAKQFDRAYIHAAWHMVLEHQRQILQSLEPATTLELLLINLVLLPDLVSLEQLSHVERLTRSTTPKQETPKQETVALLQSTQTATSIQNPTSIEGTQHKEQAVQTSPEKSLPEPSYTQATSPPSYAAEPHHFAPKSEEEPAPIRPSETERHEAHEIVESPATMETPEFSENYDADMPMMPLDDAYMRDMPEDEAYATTLQPERQSATRPTTMPQTLSEPEKNQANPLQSKLEGKLKEALREHPTAQNIQKTLNASLLRCYPTKP